MKMNKSILVCGAALALSAGVIQAQDEEKKPLPAWLDNVYLGAGLGTSIAYADIKQYDFYPVTKNKNEIGFTAGGFAGYTFTPVISAEGALHYGTLKGTDREKGLWFAGNTIETNLNLKINFTNLMFSSSAGERKFAVYGYAGFGLTMFKSELRSSGFTGDNFENDPLVAFQGYDDASLDGGSRTSELVFPIGLGLTYKLNKNWDIYADVSGRLVNSDKVDAFISDNTTNDSYNYNKVGVIYRFGNKSWVKPEDDLLSKVEALDSVLDGFKDSDKDGVADAYDKDSKTPEGAKTYGDGTAVDTDGDGVLDYVDQEKLSPCTEVDENGVALDTDKDGVPNCKDAEPNTAAGAQVDVTGKTIASMGAIATTPTDNGGSAGANVGLPSVFFAMNASSIGYTNYPSLTRVAQFMKANPNAKLLVVGHTDATGTAEYNKKLGEKRAQAVIDHLVKIYGIDASRFVISSKGNAEPLAKGTATNQNRRVDLLLTK